MPRDLSSLRVLLTAEDVIACLREDPTDRILHYACDLNPDEFIGCMATRVDTNILVVCSLKAVGADCMDAFVQANRGQGCPYGPIPGEIAVVGYEGDRDGHGRTVPTDIEQLLHDAEEKVEGRLLSWAGGYECLCVLVDHPEAEQGVGLEPIETTPPEPLPGLPEGFGRVLSNREVAMLYLESDSTEAHQAAPPEAKSEANATDAEPLFKTTFVVDVITKGAPFNSSEALRKALLDCLIDDLGWQEKVRFVDTRRGRPPLEPSGEVVCSTVSQPQVIEVSAEEVTHHAEGTA